MSEDFKKTADKALCLLQRYFEREINEEESAQLVEIWTRHPELLAEAGKNYEINHLLKFQGRMEQARRTLPIHIPLPPIAEHVPALLPLIPLAELDAIREALSSLKPPGETLIEANKEESPNKNLEKSRPKTTFNQSSRFPPSFFAVILVLFVAGFFAIYQEFNGSKSFEAGPGSDSFVRLVEAIDVQWGEGKSFKPGARLSKEKISIKGGIVKFEFDSGAELVLEGPAEFVINGKLRTFCQLGKVNVFVPKSAKGFELSTPFLRIVDLGTEFSVLADEYSSDVHVLSGKVELSRDKSETLLLTEGNAMRSASDSAIVSSLFDASACIGRNVFDTLWSKKIERQTENQNRLTQRFLTDRDLLSCFSDGRFHGPGTGNVRHGQSFTENERRMTRLKTGADRIDLDVPGTFESLTLILRARVHRLSHLSRLLIADEYYGRSGVLLWQLDTTGELQFHIRTEGPNNHDAFDLPGVFEPTDCGTWTRLAVSIDGPGKTIAHFKDGREIGRFPWNNPIPLGIGPCSIGNDKERKRTPRFLDADISDVILLSRALSADEIGDIDKMFQ